MKLLTREELLGATGCPEEPVFVHGLKSWAVMKGLTGEALDSYHQAITIGKGQKRDVNVHNLRTKLIVRTLHFGVKDERTGDLVAGARMFTDHEADLLSKIRGDVIGQLFPIAQKLSGLSDEEVEEMGKPSETTTPGVTSSSISRSN